MDIHNPFGGPVIWQAETGSTMDDAWEWWAACRDRGMTSSAWGAVIGAGHQTSGRGRHISRNWTAPSGTALTFTLVLKARADFPLSLVIACGLLHWLDTFLPDCRIKWPNDILSGGRKLSGILVESRLAGGTADDRPCLCGIGINVSQTGFARDPSMHRMPTSLAMEGILLTPQACLEGLLPHLAGAMDKESQAIRSFLESRLWKQGEETLIKDPWGREEDRIGKVRGLAADGALLLDSGGVVQHIHSGE